MNKPSVAGLTCPNCGKKLMALPPNAIESQIILYVCKNPTCDMVGVVRTTAMED